MKDHILSYVDGDCKQEGRIRIRHDILLLHTGHIPSSTNVKQFPETLLPAYYLNLHTPTLISIYYLNLIGT